MLNFYIYSQICDRITLSNHEGDYPLKQTDKDYLYKFSIITAVYNVESYLSEAIDSILTQDIGFEDSVQLILVDDGSTDHSGMICDNYQKKYPNNIKVIHQENAGVSAARNEGIRHADGRYINFMDSDDKLTSSTLSAVYDFFTQVDEQVSLVSVPIFYFEMKDEPHRLNYKYASGKAQIIDLTRHYSYVQMHIASSFIKSDVLNDHTFDTSLRYAEDSKAIMQLLFKNPRYGIVPQGRYMYRARAAMNSALNGSKLHREWYIDCLKNYIFWALDEAKALFGSVPDFVQYNVMYDLQGRFKVDEIPETVLSPHEKEIFLKMLFDAVFQIDDHIIMEQKNLSKELKDYIMSIKKAPDSGTLQYDDQKEDAWFQYPDMNTAHASSYQLRLTSMEILEHNILLEGAAKIYLRFPYPTSLFLRITSGKHTQTVKCCFHEDPEHIFGFNGQKLAVFLEFTAAIPEELFTGNIRIEFCTDSDRHTIRYRNLLCMPGFPVTVGQQDFILNRKNYSATVTSEALIFEQATPFAKAKSKTVSYLRRIRKKCKSVLQ